MRVTPNFSNWHAVILHRPDTTTDRLTRQLQLFGLSADVRWAPLTTDIRCDLLLVDADLGYDGLLPWTAGAATPCPVIALLGSEAPSRIAWAYDHGAGSILAKPLLTSAIYPSLVMALAMHEERQKHRERIEHLTERAKLRPLVFNAVRSLAGSRGMTEDEAYALLRTSAMRQREPIEAVAAAFLAGTVALPEVG